MTVSAVVWDIASPTNPLRRVTGAAIYRWSYDHAMDSKLSRSPKESTKSAPRIFYGWWTLLAVFIIMTAGSGFAFYAQGVFLKALIDEQGFSTAAASAGTGIFFLAQGVGGYFTGALISRYDARAVITFGAVISAAGIALLGEVRNEWQMVLVFILFGAGYALAGLVPATSIVTRWFHKKRSVALSIASSGLSLGGILITPKLGSVVAVDTLEDSAVTIAILYLLMMVPVVWLLLRPSPEAMGLRPDGEAALAAGVEAPPLDGWAYEEVLRSRYFWVLSGAFILVMAAQVGAIQHLYKLVSDRTDTATAGLALAVLAATSVVARITGGVVAKKVSIAKLISVLILVQIAGIGVIAVSDSKMWLVAGVVIMGAAIGNLLMLHPLLLAQTFGVREYPKIYGAGYLLMVIGVASGPFIVGFLRDVTSYRTAFLTMAALAAAGAVVFHTVGEPLPAPIPKASGAPTTSLTGESPAVAVPTGSVTAPIAPPAPRQSRPLVPPVVFDVVVLEPDDMD
jgi:MFS family permease